MLLFVKKRIRKISMINSKWWGEIHCHWCPFHTDPHIPVHFPLISLRPLGLFWLSPALNNPQLLSHGPLPVQRQSNATGTLTDLVYVNHFFQVRAVVASPLKCSYIKDCLQEPVCSGWTKLMWSQGEKTLVCTPISF